MRTSMSQRNQSGRSHNEDDLNELMPMHFKSLASLDLDKDGDTLQIHEYLGSKGQTSKSRAQSVGPLHQATSPKASVLCDKSRNNEGQQGAASAVHNGTDNSRWNRGVKAMTEQMAEEPAQQENVPPRADALALFLSKPRPKGRGLRRQFSSRVARKRSFGLDLKQLAQQTDDDDSENEWEARSQELARQRAERSAQRQRERARRQSLAGKRQSMGPQDMDLDSDDGAMEDFDFGGGGEVDGPEVDKERKAEEVAVEANGAWKTNPLFDGPGLEKPLPSQPQSAASPPPPVQAETAPLPNSTNSKPAASPISIQITPPSKTVTSHSSLTAQAQKIAEELLAQVGAAVTRAGARSDGGTQTTPSLELLALEDRPHIQPPLLALPPVPCSDPASAEKQLQPPVSGTGACEGSPLPQDVNAAMAMAAQVADDIDFPALEGSPIRADAVGLGQGEQGPRKLAFGSPVDAGQPEGGCADEEDQPEVLDDPPEEPVQVLPTNEAAPQARAPAEDRALVRSSKRKPTERYRRLKSTLSSRKSLAGAGLTIVKGVRRSTRDRVRPLEWWRNESFDWERLHDSLPTIARVLYVSPDPTWPRNGGKSAVKQRRAKAAKRLPKGKAARL